MKTVSLNPANFIGMKAFKIISIAILYLSFLVFMYFMFKPYIDPFSEQRIPIGRDEVMSDRSVSLETFWKDDSLASKLLKTGAIKPESYNKDNVAWIISVKIKNILDRNIKAGPDDFYLVDEEGRKYEHFASDILSGEIEKNKQQDGQIVFYVPKNAEINKAVYSPKYDSEKKATFFIGE